jgi:hypothetical protein
MPEGAVPASEPAEFDPNGITIGPCRPGHPARDPDRLRRRAAFLRELSQARALLVRTTSWRVMTARARARRRQTSLEA